MFIHIVLSSSFLDNVPSVTMCREKNTHCFHGKVLATFEDEKAAHAFLKSVSIIGSILKIV